MVFLFLDIDSFVVNPYVSVLFSVWNYDRLIISEREERKNARYGSKRNIIHRRGYGEYAPNIGVQSSHNATRRKNQRNQSRWSVENQTRSLSRISRLPGSKATGQKIKDWTHPVGSTVVRLSLNKVWPPTSNNPTARCLYVHNTRCCLTKSIATCLIGMINVRIGCVPTKERHV